MASIMEEFFGVRCMDPKCSVCTPLEERLARPNRCERFHEEIHANGR